MDQEKKDHRAPVGIHLHRQRPHNQPAAVIHAALLLAQQEVV